MASHGSVTQDFSSLTSSDGDDTTLDCRVDTGTQSTVTRVADSARSYEAEPELSRRSQVVLIVARDRDLRVVPLAEGQTVVVGRADSAEIQIADPDLSRMHARFRCENGTVTVTDLGSRNGTFVHRKSVREAVLRVGDSAALGSVVVSMQLVRAARLTPAPSAPVGLTPAPSAPVGLTPAPSAPVGLRPAIAVLSEPTGIVRNSEAMVALSRVIERAAQSLIPVLVLGETGTGKELVARELHELGPRAPGPLKIVNCAAIPQSLIESLLFGHKKGAFTGADADSPGVFEQARGGTVFLDEVGELTPAAQAALLRVVEDGRVCPVGSTRELEVDVRIIAATHRDLGKMSEQGGFRLDLFHRLNALTLELPPLRARREEIEPLARYFLARFAAQSGAPALQISDDALACMLAYHWPGNVRELRNVISRALALVEGDVIGCAELPAHLRQASEHCVEQAPPVSVTHPRQFRAEIKAHEATLIRAALVRAHGNRRVAAELLELPLRTLERKLSKLRIRDREDA